MSIIRHIHGVIYWCLSAAVIFQVSGYHIEGEEEEADPLDEVTKVTKAIKVKKQ